MLTVSNDFKNAYNQYTTKRKSYIKVGEDIYFIQNMDLYADTYDEGNIVGNCISKILRFEIETQYVRGLDEFELYDGIWTGEEYEYVNLGTFKLFEEQGKDEFFSSITAYDKLILFNQTFNTDIDYPITVYGLLEEICDQANVELSTQSIANGTKVLDENLFVEGETLKDILKAICQISGNYAFISNDELKLQLVGSDTLTLQNYQLSSPEYKRTTWKINQVVLAMENVEGEYVQKQDDEDVEENGVHKITINNNPFVYTQELREEYIDELFDALKGFGYIAFETSWEGLPYVELGDKLLIDGKESLVLRYELKSPDGLSSTLQAPSIIDSVIDYVDNTNDIENRLRRTEYIVDKSEGTITQIVEEISNQNNTISELRNSVEQQITSTEARIEVVENTIVSGVENLRNNLVTIDINGIHVATNQSEIETLMTNEQFVIKSGDIILAYFGYDNSIGSTKAEMDNLTVSTYFITGYHRFEKFDIDGEQRTGVFYIGE